MEHFYLVKLQGMVDNNLVMVFFLQPSFYNIRVYLVHCKNSLWLVLTLLYHPTLNQKSLVKYPLPS